MTAQLGSEIGSFFAMTVVLFGGVALLTGQRLAQSWRPGWQIVPAVLLLAAADRFLLYALFAARAAVTERGLTRAPHQGAVDLEYFGRHLERRIEPERHRAPFDRCCFAA